MRNANAVAVRNLAVLLALFSGACGPPRIDTSTEDSTENSITEVRSALEEGLRPAFDSALTVVAMAGLDGEGAFARLLAGGASVRSELDGLSAPEVIAKADSLRLVRLVTQADELEAEIEEYEDQQRQLAAVSLTDPDLEVRGNSYLAMARLKVTFTNGLDRALETAFLKVALVSPTREVPWAEKDDVYFRFDGGIEPGETVTDFGYLDDGWARLEVPGDTEIQVELTRVQFPDDTYLGSGFSAFGLGSSSVPSRDRLDALKAEIEALRRGR